MNEIISDIDSSSSEMIINFYERNNLDKNPYFDNNTLFSNCIMKGDLKLIKFLIDKNPQLLHDINDSFILACSKGHIDIVKYFYEISSNIDLSIHQHAPFRFACKSGNLELVKFLYDINFINNKTNQDFIDEDYYDSVYLSAICFASERGHLNIVKYIFDSILFIFSYSLFKLSRDTNYMFYFFETIFIECCKSNNLELVNYIYENFPNIDISSNNENAFYNAIFSLNNNNFDIINYLFEKKPDIDILVNDQYIMIDLFTLEKYDSIKYLFELKPDMNYNYEEFLIIAFDLSNFDIIQLLINKKPDIDIIINNYEEFLNIYSCYEMESEKTKEIIKFFLNKNPNFFNCINNRRIIDKNKIEFLKNIGYSIPIYWLDIIKYSEIQFECPICNEQINEYIETLCNHKFCSNCIENWIEIKSSCPYCRTEI